MNTDDTNNHGGELIPKIPLLSHDNVKRMSQDPLLTPEGVEAYINVQVSFLTKVESIDNKSSRYIIDNKFSDKCEIWDDYWDVTEKRNIKPQYLTDEQYYNEKISEDKWIAQRYILENTFSKPCETWDDYWDVTENTN